MMESADASAATDRAALVALYNGTGGPNWTDNTNWLTGAPLNQWHGVSTDGNGHVIGLHLRNNKLTGEIPPELGNLANLAELDLSRNQLSGEIPPELGKLADLTTIYLSYNHLSGGIPAWLARLPDLQRLSLAGNRLTGEIPPELGRLTELTLLSVRYNQLTGDIPPELGNLSNLERLYLSGNRFYGEIPYQFARLHNLTRLELSGNQLVGEIPPWLVGLTDLNYLDLGANRFTGEIPPWLGTLSNLEHLSLGANQFTGSIPSQLGNLSYLTYLHLGDNQLTGEIPSELENLSRLEKLYLGINQLTGEIPPWLGNLVELDTLYLRYNRLAGPIPPRLGDLTNLTRIDLTVNRLTGDIPRQLGNLLDLHYLALGDNQLTGEVPPDLGNLTNLIVLDLSYNRLTGEIPTWLPNLSQLEDLYLGGNQFTGEITAQLGSLDNLIDLDLHSLQLAGGIPPELGNLRRLNRLNLSGNGLSGPIPRELGALTNLTVLHLVSNRLAGEISPQLGELSNLRMLGLGDNQLTGDIPTELSKLSKLENLDLASNRLTAEIPPELGNLANLTALDLGHNEFSGSIPPELGNLFNLNYLRLVGNRLTGEIPAGLANLANLTHLYLAGNQLTGCIPIGLEVVLVNDLHSLDLFSCGASGPDLVVEALQTLGLSSDRVASPGAQISVFAEVHNRGDAPSAATLLRYYVSNDASFSFAGVEVAAAHMDAISASRFSVSNVAFDVPASPGTYYYIACVDPVPYEQDTLNNCSAPETIVVMGRGPDLVVDPLITAGLRAPLVFSPSDASVEPQAIFEIYAIVRNLGDTPAEGADVRFFRDGVWIGTVEVGPLPPEVDSQVHFVESAPATPGFYDYWACAHGVEGEANPNNNCSIRLTVQVIAPDTGKPDLVVVSPDVIVVRLSPGQSTTFSAVVQNQGAGTSDTSRLRYYRGAVGFRRTEVGDDHVRALAAGETQGGSIPITAPSAPGAYAYWACVDMVSGESDTQNNCSDAVDVHVSTPEPLEPDLTVRRASVDNNRPVAGSSITLTFTISNIGEGRSGQTDVTAYLSNDRAIGPDDEYIASLSLSVEPSKSIDWRRANVPVPSEPGTYYYGACVDAVSGESNTGNNCLATGAVTVTAPDLVVQEASTNPGTLGPGDQFTLSARVVNQGNGPSDDTRLRYYRSSDRTIDTSDMQVGRSDVGSLAGGGRSPRLSVGLTAPSAIGTYYYGACVDQVSAETNVRNNCSDAVDVHVSTPEPLEPDLTVRRASVDNNRPVAGSSITLTFTISNIGEGRSGQTDVTAYLSNDRAIGPDDEYIASLSLSVEPSKSIDWRRANVPVPSEPGTYYYGACVDAVSGESNTGNNCLATGAVTVTAPDLVVQEASTNPGTLGPGDQFTLSARVVNQGNGPSDDTRLRYYRSSDRTIDTSDMQVGRSDVGSLAGGGRSPRLSVGLTAPSAIGTYYYGACVDQVSAETNVRNNCSSGDAVTVIEPTPVEINEETTCGFHLSFNPFKGWGVKMEGTVKATRSVSGVTVKGYVEHQLKTGQARRRQFVGEQGLGGMSANSIVEYSIANYDIVNAFDALSREVIGCDYEFEWEP